MSVSEQHILPPEDKGLAIYSPFRAQLAEMVTQNASLIFDYGSTDGQKEARSYMHKLRLTKKPIDDARRREKAESLEYGRKVDAEGTAIVAVIDQMIEQHAKPIREVEAREQERIDGHLKVIEYIRSLDANVSMPSAEVARICKQLAAVVVDETLEEFRDETAVLYVERSTALQAVYGAAVKREQNEVELEALRAEKAERDRQDVYTKIAAESAAKARAETEAKAEKARLESEGRAEAEKTAAETRLLAERDRAVRAEANAAAATERTASAVRETEERLRLAAEQKAEAERKEQARREADREHKTVINRAIVAALMEHAGASEKTAQFVVIALASGKVPNCRIIY